MASFTQSVTGFFLSRFGNAVHPHFADLPPASARCPYPAADYSFPHHRNCNYLIENAKKNQVFTVSSSGEDCLTPAL
jgi:hypothetical protein